METEYRKYLELYYAGEQNEFLKFRDSTELSQIEKALLNTRLLLRKKKYQEAIDLMEKNRSENSYLMAQRYMQMASSYMCMGRYEEATKFGNLALRYFDETDDQYGNFVTLYNLSVCFNRMSLLSLSHYYLTQAEKMMEGLTQEVMIARQKACCLSHELKFEQALSLLEKYIPMEVTEFEKEALLIIATDIFTRAGKLEKALAAVEELVHSKSHREKARVIYYYHMLKLLLEEKELPTKPEIIDSSEEYSLKWDVVESIQAGEIELYQELMQKLGKTFPEFFDRNGKCIHKSEELGVFNRVINKFAKVDKNKTVNLSAIKGKKGKLLVEMLLNSETPIRKEYLIEQIWEIAYDPKYNSRFYKLIERVKQASEIEIKNKNNAYFIAA